MDGSKSDTFCKKMLLTPPLPDKNRGEKREMTLQKVPVCNS